MFDPISIVLMFHVCKQFQNYLCSCSSPNNFIISVFLINFFNNHNPSKPNRISSNFALALRLPFLPHAPSLAKSDCYTALHMTGVYATGNLSQFIWSSTHKTFSMQLQLLHSQWSHTFHLHTTHRLGNKLVYLPSNTPCPNI